MVQAAINGHMVKVKQLVEDKPFMGLILTMWLLIAAWTIIFGRWHCSIKLRMSFLPEWPFFQKRSPALLAFLAIKKPFGPCFYPGLLRSFHLAGILWVTEFPDNILSIDIFLLMPIKVSQWLKVKNPISSNSGRSPNSGLTSPFHLFSV